MTPLTKYELETIINFNVESTEALVYTRDKTIIRKFDALVTAYPDVYKCIAEKTAVKVLKELEVCSLIRKIRRGFCMPNLIYVKNLISTLSPDI